MKNRKLLIVLIVLTLCAIWLQSALGSAESEVESMWLFDRVYGILRFLVGPELATVHLLRKLAHFTEFFVLGLEAMSLSSLYGRRDVLSAGGVFLMCNFSAFIDETIQIFSGRGSSVTDIWIDSAGALSGIVFLTLCLAVRGLSANRKDGGE